jgi:hypothetical protein
MTVIAGATMVACNDLFDRPGSYTHYATGEAALDEHLLERGIVPPWFPSSATDIHVQTELDVGHSWVRFSLDPSRVDQILKFTRPMSLAEAKAGEGSGLGNVAWWAECAGVRLTPECERQFHYYDASSQQRRTAYLAIDKAHHVYYWDP